MGGLAKDSLGAYMRQTQATISGFPIFFLKRVAICVESIAEPTIKSIPTAASISRFSLKKTKPIAVA